MKRKFFSAIFALALCAAGASPAIAHERDQGRDSYRHSPALRMMDISVRVRGRTFEFGYGDRMFMRLIDAPYSFVPGLNYVYTDRCNRSGCVVFVYDGYRDRPVDRIFAPHLPLRGYAWRQARDFDPRYERYGGYDRDDRTFDDRWRYDGERGDNRRDSDGRGWNDGSGLEGGPYRR